MSTLREAAQQALEALEQDNPSGRTATITALRAALAEFNPDWDQIEPLQNNLREYMAEIQKLRAQRDALREALKKPLAEWQISDLMADIDPEDVCSWSFRQGVYAAEKHHGIKP